MKAKRYFNEKWVGLKALLLGSLVVVALGSCQEDDVESGGKPFITLTEEAYTFSASGENHDFTVYSNTDWRVELADTSLKWISVWPGEGSKDGNFTLKVTKQGTKPELREALVRVIGKKNKELNKTFVVSQREIDPSIKIDVATVPAKVVVVSAGVKEHVINVTSNVEWTAVVNDAGKEWITIDEITEKYIKFSVPKYSGEILRTARIEFNAVAEKMQPVELIVSQSAPLNIGENAELKSIAEVFALIPGGRPTGPIYEDVKVQATVISDIDNGNNPLTASFYVQDASGRAIQFRVEEGSHALKMGSLVTIPMKDTKFSTDDNGQIYVTISAERIKEVVVGGGQIPAAKELASVSEITEIMLNTLVTIDNLEYVMPYGTYFSANETTVYKGGITNDLPLLMLDKDGNQIENYIFGGLSIEGGAQFKHYELLSKGVLNITGILSKMNGQWVLRMRNIQDRDASAASNKYSPIIEFYWNKAIENGIEMTPKLGAGELYVNFTDKKTATSGNLRLYTTSAYLRTSIDKMAEGTNNTYHSLNCAGWGQPDADAKGLAKTERAWILKTSTSGVNDKLIVAVASSSSGSGPGRYKMEWAPSETGPWGAVADYQPGNWNNPPSTKVMSFELPDGCKNQTNLFIRLRISADERVEQTGTTIATIGTGGTNRLTYIAVKKKVN